MWMKKRLIQPPYQVLPQFSDKSKIVAGNSDFLTWSVQSKPKNYIMSAVIFEDYCGNISSSEDGRAMGGKQLQPQKAN